MGKIKNLCKNLLVVLLILSALYMTTLVWSYTMGVSEIELINRALGRERQETVLYPNYAELSYALRVVTPLKCAVRASEGAGLYSTPDGDTASTCFETAQVVLAEALETAGEPILSTSYQWREALSGTMVFLDFDGCFPLDTLARLIGAEPPDYLTADARYIVLSIREDRVVLYYKTDERTIYCMDTESDAEYLRKLCGDYVGNGSRFAYEENLADARDVLLLRPELTCTGLTAQSVTAIASESDTNRIMTAVLEGFGFKAYTARAYREKDGTQVYVDEERTLRVGTDGYVTYYNPAKLSSDTAPTGEASTARIAEAARLVSEMLTPTLGDARLYLQSGSYDAQTGLYTVRFGAAYDGIRILGEPGFTARVEFRGAELVAADVCLTSYRASGTVNLIPASQALAAASSTAGFGLYYSVTDSGVEAGWYNIAESVEKAG